LRALTIAASVRPATAETASWDAQVGWGCMQLVLLVMHIANSRALFADIDECALNRGGCDALVSCTNTAGSFECGACPAGFTGAGTSASPCIGQCLVLNSLVASLSPCLLASVVMSVQTWTSALCPTAAATPACDATTRPLHSTAVFARPASRDLVLGRRAAAVGFCLFLLVCLPVCCRPLCELNCPVARAGDLCADIDECADNHGNCDPLVRCTNSVGSFSCGRCPHGYIGQAGKCIGACIDLLTWRF
jgi:hypothetical protein